VEYRDKHLARDLLRRYDLVAATTAALEHLAEVDPPFPGDAESSIGIKKLRGYFAGLLGRYKASHQLLHDAEELARDANLVEALAEVPQCQAMI
jgi:hypothetical protein